MDTLNADMLFHRLASPNKTFEKPQSPKLQNTSFDYIQVFFFLKKGVGKEENKTSPVNRNSLLQTVFAPNPFPFQVSKILVLSHCSDGQSTFQRFCVPLQQREEE